MIVKYSKEKEEYYVDVRLGAQTMHMALSMIDWSGDTVTFNIYLTLYNKRNQITNNEAEAKITGASPISSFIIARKAFQELVKKVLYNYSDRYDVIVLCTWLDNRRRDAYYKYLSTKGYRYGHIDGVKCIFKRYKKGTAYEV